MKQCGFVLRRQLEGRPEFGRGASEVSLLSQNGTQFIVQLRLIRCKLDGLMHFCSGFVELLSAAERPSESFVRLRLSWRKLHGDSQFRDCLVPFSALRQRTTEIDMCNSEIRLQSCDNSKVSDGLIDGTHFEQYLP